MVVVVILHLARVFYTAAYTKTRRINWIIGLLLLLITILFSFSGYLLPWDQLAYWATTIAVNIAASFDELTEALGLTSYLYIGTLIKHFLLGANTVSQEALNRFYLLHIVVLPLGGIILIGFHFWRIRKSNGLSLPNNADQLVAIKENHFDHSAAGKKQTHSIKKQNAQTIHSWPLLMWTELSVFMMCLAVLIIFSYFIDAPLREMANPAVPENPAKSPWYFLGLQELVSYSAFSGGIVIPALLLLSLFLIPYLDREEKLCGIWFSGKQGRIISLYSTSYALIITCGMIFLTIQVGWLRDWFPEISQIIVICINPATMLTILYALWSVAVLKKTESTRMAAIAIFTCILVGFIVYTMVGNWFRGANWEFSLF
jgi:quinol-cytochrome oxidoreductase complex cytochrome b subunit